MTAIQIEHDISSFEGQRPSHLPPLGIATDQEGGGVSRLSPPLTRLPPIAEVVGRFADIEQRRRAIEQYATTQGRELAALGVNVNFAPVVDINHQAGRLDRVRLQQSERRLARALRRCR